MESLAEKMDETDDRRFVGDRREDKRRKAVSHRYLGDGYKYLNRRQNDRRAAEEDRRGVRERELEKEMYGYIGKGWL